MERVPSRSIFHVDGDAFFASCEVARNPALRGKPVVTGQERGIVSAATYEAKKLGITRGIPLSQVRKICPDVIILPSDYETYGMYSRRMYAIARRYTPLIEEYGIDECFGDLTGLEEERGMSCEAMARSMQEDMRRELNMTFSVGLGPTKVLAKLGSKWKKPNGFTVITRETAPEFLAATPLHKVWGIGGRTALMLQKQGLVTALDFTQKPEWWIRETLTKPLVELWQELRGESVMSLHTGPDDIPYSIQVTRTFRPRREEDYLRSQLSKNIEGACAKARRKGLAAREVSFFIKTQSFEYARMHQVLAHASNAPQEILAVVLDLFPRLFQKGPQYRATGVTLHGLKDAKEVQPELFAPANNSADRLTKLYTSVDALTKRFGSGTVYLGSSALARESGRRSEGIAERTRRLETLFMGADGGKRLPLPYLGEVN